MDQNTQGTPIPQNDAPVAPEVVIDETAPVEATPTEPAAPEAPAEEAPQA